MSADARSSSRADEIYARMGELTGEPASLMEVCGTHTMAIGRHGLRTRLPTGLRLLAGPGCPVCVTPGGQIDEVAAMASTPGVTVTTFGDMVRVPGARTSLERARASGGDVRIVYSVSDALLLASREPGRLVVFFGVGFETTSPTVAATLAEAARRGAGNFLVYPSFKLIPPAMSALLDSGESLIHGFICPGHVSVVIGTGPYEHIAQHHRVPCVITGFEALDILEGIVMLLEQRAASQARVEIQYRRAVRPAGNPIARDLLGRVFKPCDADWRGIGTIPGSGLELSPEFAMFDARTRIPVTVEPGPDLAGPCACGEIMRGILSPPECTLFGRACTPATPVGPCMVSSEGACAAYMRYGG